MSVLHRERRKNAGKRMAILGKKLEEEDDAFWSHETWADDDSGNESFHESDEDSALQKDVFDSDFNDSESDNEEEEVMAGEAEERELRKTERRNRRQNNNSAYNFQTLGGNNRKRGFPSGSKRVFGEGFNAGIVLNLPPESFDSLSYVASISAKLGAPQQFGQTKSSASVRSTTDPSIATRTTPAVLDRLGSLQIAVSSSTATSASKTKTKTTSDFARKSTRSSTASLRERRSTQGVRKLRENSRAPSRRRDLSTTHKDNASVRKTPNSNCSDNIPRDSTALKRKRFAQEELLLEAVHETEPENRRWLHGRKRVQDQYNRDKDSKAGGLRDKYRGKKVVQKFHSRRGCLTTLTFPEMDFVPEILARRKQNTKHHPARGIGQDFHHHPPSTTSSSMKGLSQQQQLRRCVITGKTGNYKDPLTNYLYHDLAAFKELRRRHKDGEEILKEFTSINSSRSHVGGEGIKEPQTLPGNGPVKKKTVSKRENTNGPSSNVDNNMNTAIPRDEEKKRLSSTVAINVNNKLPFQSPKPPPRLSTGNGATTMKQQLPSAEGLAFTWGAKTKSSATKTDATKNLNAPVSPSRRLSPRKRKPSEKVLQTIAMLPGTESGNITLVPRGLGIQPFLAPSLSNQVCPNNNINGGAVDDNHPVSGPSVSVTLTKSLAQKLSPPAVSQNFCKEGNQKDQNSTKELSTRGFDLLTRNVETNITIEKSCHNTNQGSKTTPRSREVLNCQNMTDVQTPIT